MKRIVHILAALLLPIAILAALVPLAWEDNQNPGGTTYRIYELQGTSWVRVATTTEKTAAVPFNQGQHTVVVRAVSAQGIESDDSNAVAFTVPYKVTLTIVVSP